jgi:signal transduction histidine kinase
MISMSRMELLGYASVLTILGAVVVGSVVQLSLLGDAKAQANRKQQVIYALDKIRSAIVDAETGQRGFLITANEAYRQPYDQALLRIGGDLETLQALLDDEPQREIVAALTERIASKVEELERRLQVRREQGFEAAAATIVAEGAHESMDRIRELLVDLERREQQALEGAMFRAAGYRRTAMIATITAGSIALSLVVLAIISTHRSNCRRRKAERQMLAALDAARQAEVQVHQINEQLQASNNAKDHFLSTLSHELRTPLTPVLAAVELIEVEGCPAEELRQQMGMIRRNVELEVRLIDDLLDLTRISRGKVRLHLAVEDVHEKLRHVIEILGPEIRSKELRLTLELSAESATVMADAPRIQQTLWNLLRNAVKFTPARGEVRIRTFNPAADQVGIEVSDSGIGIEPHVLPRIFDSFDQGGPEVTRLFGGLGIGLTISRALAELHGGALTADSEGKGRGARFLLSLPVVHQPAASVERGRDLPPRRLPRQGCRILLVEDHADTCRMMSRVLERGGHTVRSAGTVAMALEAARSEPFDLLISDIGLPDGSGLELIQQLLEMRPITGIALSGHGTAEDIRRSRDAGFVEHLTKPVSLGQLDRTIQQLI